MTRDTGSIVESVKVLGEIDFFSVAGTRRGENKRREK